MRLLHLRYLWISLAVVMAVTAEAEETTTAMEPEPEEVEVLAEDASVVPESPSPAAPFSSDQDPFMHVHQFQASLTRQVLPAKDVAFRTINHLDIFCHSGSPYSLVLFWSSSVFRLKMESDEFRVFLANNASEVKKLSDQHRSAWLPSSLPWKSKDLKVNPFKKTCVGVVTQEPFEVMLQVYRINYWQVVMTFLGAFLFLSAPRLCRNTFFHYTTGVATGILFSMLVVTYVLQKKARASWASWIMLVYSFSVYCLTWFWSNLINYVAENQIYVIGYLVVTGMMSFAICYRMGPVENARTLNLIQWALQMFALTLIYLSSYHQVASLSLALLFLTWSSVPDLWKAKSRTWYRRRFFQPKVRLLTETEYLDQSRIETERALEDLRKYCRSPASNQWGLVRRLKSPGRFAEFIEGSPHLTENEVMDYSHAELDDDLIGGGDSDSDADADERPGSAGEVAAAVTADNLTDDEDDMRMEIGAY